MDSYPVRMMCELLVVSASGFYAARSRAPSIRSVEQEQELITLGTFRRALPPNTGYVYSRINRRGTSC